MLFELFLIREFETTLLHLFADGCVHGPVHTSIGQEACAAGAMAALRPTDKIAATHRAHHHYLAKLISYHAADGFDPLDRVLPEIVQQEVTELLGEVMGLSIGCCGGRGGSMHLRNEKRGILGTNAIVAGGVPLATGAAFASRYGQTEEVVVCFLGDGAVNQGSFHEALNLAGIWKLPIVYFIENNQYAVGTSIRRSTATEYLAQKAGAYGLRALVVDGMNPLAVLGAVEEAARHVRGGAGAMVVEAQCYRFPHHGGAAPGSSFGYRSKEEEEQWQKRDAMKIFPEEVVRRSILTEPQVDALREKARHLVANAREFCTTSTNGKCQVKAELWPAAESLETGLRSDGQEFREIVFQEKEDFSQWETVSYVEAISAVTGRHLEKDEKVFVLGVEVANFGAGAYGATKGLSGRYPQRVLNTPISECGFSGLAGGAAMSGLHPVVEIMYPDFALVAADQLFNQIGKLRHMYGNSTDMPVVVRTRVAIGCGYGGQHSMDPVGLFSLFSGWRILAPSNAFDYIGLFNSAMRSRDPVLIVEHHELYPMKSEVPRGNRDYYIPIGKARVVRAGRDVTVLCYSRMVALCCQAAQELAAQGIEAEIIDLRTVSSLDVDYAAIGASLVKTNSLVIVEQAPRSHTVGPRIAAQCQSRFFDYLDGPIVTLAARDIPNPVSRWLEAAAVPTIESIKEAIAQAARRQA